MKKFTLRKGFLDCKSGTSSLFKGFVMLVVLMLMTTSSAMAQEPKFEVIDGFRYLLDSGTKTATLVPPKDGDYSGDIIIIPEKVKGNDGVEYVVTSFGASCFKECRGLTSITIPSSVTSLGQSCFMYCI
uniref:leucine-rich repeat protein n=1 Tax=Prevotella sp. TaxID=59823 RepID=UPI0040284BD8